MQDVVERRRFALSFIITLCLLIFLIGTMEINGTARATLQGDRTPAMEYTAEVLDGLLPDDVTGAELFRCARGIAGDFDPYIGAAVDICVFVCGALSEYFPG